MNLDQWKTLLAYLQILCSLVPHTKLKLIGTNKTQRPISAMLKFGVKPGKTDKIGTNGGILH